MHPADTPGTIAMNDDLRGLVRSTANFGALLGPAVMESLPAAQRAIVNRYLADGAQAALTIRWAAGTHCEVRFGLLVDGNETLPLLACNFDKRPTGVQQ
jgi:hypothetical protein